MSNPHRLQATVSPVHYRIRITPDLERAVFTGTVSIDLEVNEGTAEFEVHALDLELSSVDFTQNGVTVQPTVTHVAEYQRVRLDLPNKAVPGPARLDVVFSGTLNDLLVGFYKSTYIDGDGTEQTIATTQFESTDARRAFPCFDEPSFKATFGVTLVVPDHLMAISNYPEADRQSAGDSLVAITFEDTMKMSTYLVAFVIGPFEATEAVVVNGVPVRVVVPRGRLEMASFALDSAAFALDYLSEYYGIPYPGRKLDNVAIPDFAFGAMENLGCVTYRESALLLDQANSSQAERLRVMDVIGHELAHMWFGDLVTMEWWDGIWLNEAFATFMEMKATDAARPDWKRWLSFGAEERPWAFGTDSLHTSRPVEFEVESPADANAMFDALTYGKGSSVLRMMEQFIGEEAFREGVGAYLNQHMHANTVTDDLWRGLESASDVAVREVMNPWIHQRGYPQIDVKVSGASIQLEQRRYLAIPDETDTTLWPVPLKIRGSAAGKPFETNLLFDTPGTSIPLETTPDFVVANAGGHGYFRVRYQPATLESLLDRLDQLDDLERFCLLDDTWAFVESGESEIGHFLALADAYREETELSIYQRLLRHIDKVGHHLIDDEIRPQFEKWVAYLLQPAFDRLTWDHKPDDTDLTRRLRGQLVGALGRLASVDEVIANSQRIGLAWLSDPNGLDPDVAQASVVTLATTKGDELWDSLWEAYEETDNPQRQLRVLHAIASAGFETTIDATIDALLGGQIRSQDAAWVSGELLASKRNGSHSWSRIRSQWNEITAKMPSMTLYRMLEGLPALSEPTVAADVKAFFAETKVPAAERALSQQLERLQINQNLRSGQKAAASDFFAG